jgi:ectoine hydroxylase-related dioxygenase (phytanoyl-CoA dioxygenase family)
MTLGRGDAVIIDSTTVHQGGANISAARPRPVFYFSFLSPVGARPVGATYSILKGEREKFTLAQFF